MQNETHIPTRIMNGPNCRVSTCMKCRRDIYWSSTYLAWYSLMENSLSFAKSVEYRCR